MTLTLKKWNHYTDGPLLVLSVVFLFAYSWEILAETHVTLCNRVIDVIWAIYAIDYVVELLLAENRKVWFRKNLLLLVSIALPMFRPLRLLQLVAMLHMFNHGAGFAVRGKITLYAAVMICLVLYVGALAEYSVEHNAPGARITNFPTAMWWAFVTVTTVGYGDIYPVTSMGRLIAIILMLTGIALIGIVTAMIASWIIDQVNRESVTETNADIANTDAQTKLLQGQMYALSDSVAELNHEIERLRKDSKKVGKRLRAHESGQPMQAELQHASQHAQQHAESQHAPLPNPQHPTIPFQPLTYGHGGYGAYGGYGAGGAGRPSRRYHPSQPHYTSPRRKRGG
ncbi:potassium channel family protein [Bifidobacterium choloepi]|uniref:potassium channel family protein n=1 Tax=Bifidobacterium choloepi TaxID=2614131 RepID=UPI0038B2680D